MAFFYAFFLYSYLWWDAGYVSQSERGYIAIDTGVDGWMVNSERELMEYL